MPRAGRRRSPTGVGRRRASPTAFPPPRPPLRMAHPALQLLEEEPILQRVGEALGDFARLPGLDSGETDRLRALYFAELDALDPAAQGRLVVDKFPLTITRAPLIHRLFP